MRKLALVLITLALGPLLGWASARIMLDRSAITVSSNVGGWQEVGYAPGSLAALYESGYYLARGQVPPPQNVRQFVRKRDDEGNTLRADCATRLEGLPPTARWWQVNAEFRTETRALSKGSVVLEGNGNYVVTLWNAVTPGNWLDLGNNSDYVMRLIVHDSSGEDGTAVQLPSVRRMWC